MSYADHGNPQNERSQKWARARAHGADGNELAEPDSKSMWRCVCLRPSTFPSQLTFFKTLFKTHARQGRNQDAVGFQTSVCPRAPKLQVSHTCAHACSTWAESSSSPQAALSVTRLIGPPYTLFPNSSPFCASAAASAVCLPLASSSLCWGCRR